MKRQEQKQRRRRAEARACILSFLLHYCMHATLHAIWHASHAKCALLIAPSRHTSDVWLHTNECGVHTYECGVGNECVTSQRVCIVAQTLSCDQSRSRALNHAFSHVFKHPCLASRYRALVPSQVPMVTSMMVVESLIAHASLCPEPLCACKFHLSCPHSYAAGSQTVSCCSASCLGTHAPAGRPPALRN